ncbi:E3 ubiquitin-protein ligase TRIM39-like isoform X2 [Tachysurus fulvidraco]|uniref:E3 ubiquitin-protein ligase TRIM39-like isoform X2 n=1 Tax=Tachysurus fulvidraco TaxID=1234273 RepID=UPI001FF01A62|nr:E3 ubiquitin-protein ligase TRIM39-like isoform X2 [Tachysurus fulvidraco]
MAESLSQTKGRKTRSMEEPESFSHDFSSLLSEDLLLCPICVYVLTDPVTTPCGHNFCNSCLTWCWDKSQHCLCPLCNQKFNKRPELKINTTLREVADYFKKKRELKRIQQYAVDVTLDPDTAHPDLILSADGKQVTYGDTQQNLPDTQQRLNPCICVLGKQSFSSGRFYYEVQVRGKTEWTLGVVRGNINRKGEMILTPQDGLWTVILRNKDQYKACPGPPVLITLREKVEVVGVFVDYEEGLVSFYDVKSRSHIYSFTDQSFTEKLYPYFSPDLNNEGKNSAPLIISPVFKTE